VRRSALIFAIGLFLNGIPYFDLRAIRIMGVLQRIALCYLAAGLLYLATCRREATADGKVCVRANIGAIASVALILLVGYWALMTFVPVPGYGAGHLGKDDNLGAYIDRALLGGHLWSESKTWDPEGLLSTLPAIATALIGILAGEWLRSERRGTRKVLGLVIAGAVLMLAGRLLHPYFPINKNLWTSTFVLFTGGFAMLLHQAAAQHLAVIRAFVEDLARQAGVEHPKEVAFQLQLLMIGAIVIRSAGRTSAFRTSILSPRLTPTFLRTSPSIRMMPLPSSSCMTRNSFAAVDFLPMIWMISPTSTPSATRVFVSTRARPKPTSDWGASATLRTIRSGTGLRTPPAYIKVPGR